jgi:hypothetical protein
VTDPYTRVVLTVIAVALSVIALRGLPLPIPDAQAAETIECRFSDAVRIESFRDALTVKLDAQYDQPGVSSGRPLYVKLVE